jgi:hypothetical protein
LQRHDAGWNDEDERQYGRGSDANEPRGERLMFFLFSNRLGCLGSILVSVLLSGLLLLLMRGCSAGPGVAF